jgi:VanZ family protein
MDTLLSRQRIRTLILDWLPLLLWLMWIFWLSSQPKLPHPARKMGISDYLFDYSAHAFTFAVVVLLAWRVAWARPTLLPNAVISLAWLSAGLFATLYAVSDELHQAFVRGRTASLRDWLADVAGILVMTGLLRAWEHYVARKRR